jgi:lipopolysaccharide transport system permease protein
MMSTATSGRGRVLRGLWSHRYLMFSLVRRQYQLRYRQSMMGLAWAIVPTLVTLAAATLVFHKVAKVDTGSIPYPIFMFAALVPWTFFAGSVTFGVQSITAFQTMVSRLPFPTATIPFSVIGTAFIDLGISAVIFVAFSVVTGYGVPATAVWFPVLLAIEIPLVLGVVLLGSALNVFARDIKLAVPLFTQLWLFVTPVMYPLSAVPHNLRTFYMLNPMTGIVESSRRILLLGQAPSFSLLLPAIIGAVVLFAVGIWYFGATESRFADVL